ncbi:putative X-Pro dipeptidase/ABC transporter [Streptomyces graminofaciens]|uniref:X-Pro dipeptidase/ABC transporter n=1 Tax=Streptomyces graminofaciens TaxID=68212 RepID=A0ABN5VSP7_9ACTN|nr:alpha/beta fold hydrolase [Streptomyces graminofaciens]BBC36213.1 putative X-Pro dipeptidase/ABC transporter [Streptomyces graminofaciens]
MDLRLPALRRALTRRPRRTIAAAAAVVVLAGAGTWTATASDEAAPVKRTDQVMDTAKGVRIDTSYFTSGSSGRRPAVLLTHGFGGEKGDVRRQAEDLARDGYAVLTWSARGFGESTGKIGLNDPKGEVADVSKLIDWLAKRPEVELDRSGDPRVGAAGASYGGAVSLLAAGYDDRIDAIAPAITYWNLSDALFPNGVYKKLWTGLFFNTGGGCDKFETQLCQMYERVAEAGQPDADAVKLLEERSPEAVGDRIKVPTLLMQGQTDSLFPLGQADAAAKAIKANGAPVDVDWISGGHDGGDMETDRVQSRVTAWFDRYLKDDKSADTGPEFRVSRTRGTGSGDGETRIEGENADKYPGLESETRSFALSGREQTFDNPAGANPPAVSALPGLGSGAGGLAQLSSLGVSISLDFPGQYAAFESKPVADDVQITGSPTATVHVKSTSEDAVLFAKVYDVGPDGRSQVLPSSLVEPLRVEGARSGKDVKLTLPAIDHDLDDGHRLRLVLAPTDLGYASPTAPATYTVSLKGDLKVPTPLGGLDGTGTLPAWVWYLPLAGAAIAAALLLSGRRRAAPPAPADPALAEVPLQITDLSKKYRNGDRYSVRDVSFRVEKGQVLGLLGPNGAGKTTTLRMLMGLIQPDGGEIRVFGHVIVPGAPVLSRVGAFVEGAGFLPHLSGRENLELYWQATGRPPQDAHLEEALEIAGLGDALARAVRTYSQGMRQRLAIAQAMLGLPDLLILDEPTNGLDPPQIREMREVMIRYAAAGRTVIVSSHLLAEVEQTCTHLVVMDHGQLVQAGPVGEIVGSGDTLLVGTAEPVDEPLVDKVAALPGIESAVRTDEGLVVRLDAGGSAQRLIAELVRLEIPVASVGPHRRLEDAFLTLIGESA